MLFPLWLDRMRDQLHPESYIIRLQSTWKTFYKEDSIVDVPVNKLTKAIMEDWMYKLIRENKIVSKKKYYNATTIMRQILRYAADTLEIIEKAKVFQMEHGVQTEFVFSITDRHISPWAVDNVFRKISGSSAVRCAVHIRRGKHIFHII